MHAAFNADAWLLEGCEEAVPRHEVVAWAKTMAICTVAKAATGAVDLVFQQAHLLVAEVADQAVEVLGCESEEHGGREWFEMFDDLQVQLLGELHERGHF